jgi:hypothetical protein
MAVAVNGVRRHVDDRIVRCSSPGVVCGPGLLARHGIVLVEHTLKLWLDDAHPHPTAAPTTLRGVRLRDERYRIPLDRGFGRPLNGLEIKNVALQSPRLN